MRRENNMTGNLLQGDTHSAQPGLKPAVLMGTLPQGQQQSINRTLSGHADFLWQRLSLDETHVIDVGVLLLLERILIDGLQLITVVDITDTSAQHDITRVHPTTLAI